MARELDASARKFGSSAAELISAAQAKAHDSGLQGFYFVAGAASEETAVIKEALKTGYSAVTMYNMHRPPLSKRSRTLMPNWTMDIVRIGEPMRPQALYPYFSNDVGMG